MKTEGLCLWSSKWKTAITRLLTQLRHNTVADNVIYWATTQGTCSTLGHTDSLSNIVFSQYNVNSPLSVFFFFKCTVWICYILSDSAQSSYHSISVLVTGWQQISLQLDVVYHNAGYSSLPG